MKLSEAIAKAGTNQAEVCFLFYSIRKHSDRPPNFFVEELPAQVHARYHFQEAWKRYAVKVGDVYFNTLVGDPEQVQLTSISEEELERMKTEVVKRGRRVLTPDDLRAMGHTPM